MPEHVNDAPWSGYMPGDLVVVDGGPEHETVDSVDQAAGLVWTDKRDEVTCDRVKLVAAIPYTGRVYPKGWRIELE